MSVATRCLLSLQPGAGAPDAPVRGPSAACFLPKRNRQQLVIVMFWASASAVCVPHLQRCTHISATTLMFLVASSVTEPLFACASNPEIRPGSLIDRYPSAHVMVTRRTVAGRCTAGDCPASPPTAPVSSALGLDASAACPAPWLPLKLLDVEAADSALSAEGRASCPPASAGRSPSLLLLAAAIKPSPCTTTVISSGSPSLASKARRRAHHMCAHAESRGASTTLFLAGLRLCRMAT